MTEIFYEHILAELWSRSLAENVDRYSCEIFSIPTLTLMENAGKAVADAIKANSNNLAVIILAGTGNNGGDALVCARHLQQMKFTVQVFIVSDKTQPTYTASCKEQLKQVEQQNIVYTFYKIGDLLRLPNKPYVVVDGILGLGFKGSLRDGLIKQCLTEAANLKQKTVYAIDLPSGLDADCGHQQNIPLTANYTITFGAKKFAHVACDSRELCGEISVIDIGFAKEAIIKAQNEQKHRLFHQQKANILQINQWQKLPKNAHKYTRGHILVIGGSLGKSGAPLLSAMAALRCGAGWASVAMPKNALHAELKTLPLELTFENFFELEKINQQNLKKFLEERNVKAVVIGPGWMEQRLDQQAFSVLFEFNHNQGGFLVFDAGALQDIGNFLEDFPLEPTRTVLTPHPGEWRKLNSKMEIAPPLRIDQDVPKALEQAVDWGVTLVYKSATPIVLPCPDQRQHITIDSSGQNILARAGSGDVLSGLIAAHGAVGYDAKTAVLRSLALLAQASELAAKDVGHHAVLASDIVQRMGIANQ